MGLLDDWMDLKWRYKAFMPLIAALPLVYLAITDGLRTSIALPLIGTIEFSSYYYFLIIHCKPVRWTEWAGNSLSRNSFDGINGSVAVTPDIDAWTFNLLVDSCRF